VYVLVIELPDRYKMHEMKMMAMTNSTQAREALIYPDAPDFESAGSLLEVCQEFVKSLLIGPAILQQTEKASLEVWRSCR